MMSRADSNREDGGAYIVGFLAAAPAVVLLILLFLELHSMLETRLGMTYAAFAAGRSYIAWEMVGPDLAVLKANQAATLAMVPSSSSRDDHQPVNPGEDQRARAREFARFAVRALARSATESQLARLYLRAEAATLVTVEPVPSGPELGATRQIKVCLKYDAPFVSSWLGFLFGHTSESFRGPVQTLTTTLVLDAQEEVPHGLGIGPEAQP